MFQMKKNIAAQTLILIIEKDSIYDALWLWIFYYYIILFFLKKLIILFSKDGVKWK